MITKNIFVNKADFDLDRKEYLILPKNLLSEAKKDETLKYKDIYWRIMDTNFADKKGKGVIILRITLAYAIHDIGDNPDYNLIEKTEA